MSIINKSISAQFKLFYNQNNPKNMQEAINNFAIFGGYDKKIDTSCDITTSIKNNILNDYKYIRNQIGELTKEDHIYNTFLTAIATGDGRIHSSYRRSRLSAYDGDNAMDFLLGNEIIYRVHDNLYFSSPFVRFWFAFVSPFFKGIKQGDYKEAESSFAKTADNFISLVFNQLSMEVLKKHFYGGDYLKKIYPYYDNGSEIDIFAKTKTNKIIVGTCKYNNSKMNKKELSSLKEKASSLGIEADMFVFFAKKGFSSEFKALRSEEIKLFRLNNFSTLLS